MYKLVLVFFKSVANNQATIWWLFLQQVHKLQQVQIPTSQPEIEKNPWSQRQAGSASWRWTVRRTATTTSTTTTASLEGLP